MNKDVDISENFWPEYETRGFALQKETGGNFQAAYANACIKKYNQKIYQIMSINKTDKINIIDSKLFFETVKKIETMVNFRLFD